MWACCKSRMPGPTSAAPMNEQAIGLVAVSWNLQMPRAIASMSVIDCGVRMTSIWSMFGSSSTACQRGSVAVGAGVADDVDGVLQVGRGGQRAAHLLHRVGGASRGTDSPQRMAASVAITPGPPALVTIARRLPAGRG